MNWAMDRLDFLITLILWTNLLVALIVILAFVHRVVMLRRILAWFVMVCVTATLILFVLVGRLVPMIGSFLWILGILMILAAELSEKKTGPMTEERHIRAATPIRRWLAANPGVIALCRIFGICIFAAAFFLPACTDGGEGGGIHSGIDCALWTISGTITFLLNTTTNFSAFFAEADVFELFIFGIIGLINPLVVLILFFSYSNRFLMARRILAGIVLVCTALASIFLAQNHMVPLIGHYLWTTGILIVLATAAYDSETGPSEDYGTGPSQKDKLLSLHLKD
jgi:hypothetical protein